MDRPPLIVLEVVLGFVVPVGWGVWELISLRRDRKRQEREARARKGIGGVQPVPVAGRDQPKA